MRLTLLLGLLIAVGSELGCAIQIEQRYRHLKPYLLAKRYDQALRFIDSGKKTFYGKHNALLYDMDKGAVAAMADQVQLANQSLEHGKQLSNDLWTKRIGEEIAVWLANDNALGYRGEDFEITMLHTLMMFNYLNRGAIDEALVEARQINNQLAHIQQQSHQLFAYHEDGFARWLSGLLRAQSLEPGAANDAWIDFKRALHVYEAIYTKNYQTPVPKLLIQAASNCLSHLGADFAADVAGFSRHYPQVVPQPTLSPNHVRILALVQSGEAPYKQEAYWTALVGVNVIRVAYPVFIAKPQLSTGIAIRDLHQPQRWIAGEKVQDIAAIAMSNLEEHLKQIKDRSIARAVANFTAGAAAEVAGNQMRNGAVGAAVMAAGWLWNWGHALAEHADTRSWITLPATIYAVEIDAVAPATVEIVLHDAQGYILEHWQKKVPAIGSQTGFVVVRSLY